MNLKLSLLFLLITANAVLAQPAEFSPVSRNDMITPAAPNRMKDIFPIGIWYDGRVEGINCPKPYVDVPFGIENARAYYEKTFKDIKAHNIDIIVIPNTPPQYRQILFETADKVGVKIVMELIESADINFGGRLCIRNPDMIQNEQELYKELSQIIGPISKHKSLFAYQLIDEPPVEFYHNWYLQSRILGELDPMHPSFSAICYEEDLPRTSSMGTQMLVFDHYPITEKSKPGDYDFNRWIALMDKLDYYSKKNNIPYWIVVQAFDKPSVFRHPTEPELRLMTYLSLAHNSKGVFFFLYNSMTEDELMTGTVDVELNPQPIWQDVSALAGELQKLSSILPDIKPAQLMAKSSQHVDVQSFVDSRGKKYLFISNLDVLNPVTAKVQFEGVSVKHARSLLTKKTFKINFAEDGSSFISVELSPGYCQLLQLK